MSNRWAAGALVVAALGCASTTPEQQVLNDAVAALGGRARLESIRSLVLEDGSGRQFNLGQDMTPDARGQTFTVSGLSRRVDLTTPRIRTELTRTPTFAYFQGPAPARQVQGLDGEIGYNINVKGTGVRVPEQTTRERRADYYHHPVTLLRAALAADARLATPRTVGAERLVDVTLPDGQIFTLAVDSSGLATRIESPGAHPNLGDVRHATLFSDYQDVSGVRLPATIATRIDDFVTAEIRFGRQSVDGDVGNIAAPAEAASAAPPAAPPPTVAVEDIAPGVWLLAGQSHHTAVIEMSDHLMLVDAPQSEARTLAVLARAQELKPDKPLRTMVTTHHHFDHTAGIRAAVARGLTILTHDGNRVFFETVTARPHTRVPDTLAKSPRAAVIETVADERVIEDSLRRVAILHLSGNPHSDTMLAVHLPAERVLIQVDAFSPGTAVNPYAANLLDHITKRKLAVDRIVPLHGAVTPLADLVKTVAANH